LGIARGSNFELQTQLEIARSLGMENAKIGDEAAALSHEIGNMLYAILDKLRAKAPAAAYRSLTPEA
jgi:four helix bundle protein